MYQKYTIWEDALTSEMTSRWYHFRHIWEQNGLSKTWDKYLGFYRRRSSYSESSRATVSEAKPSVLSVSCGMFGNVFDVMTCWFWSGCSGIWEHGPGKTLGSKAQSWIVFVYVWWWFMTVIVCMYNCIHGERLIQVYTCIMTLRSPVGQGFWYGKNGQKHVMCGMILRWMSC